MTAFEAGCPRPVILPDGRGGRPSIIPSLADLDRERAGVVGRQLEAVRLELAGCAEQAVLAGPPGDAAQVRLPYLERRQRELERELAELHQ